MTGAGSFAATCGLAADVAAEDPGAGAAFGVLGVAEGGAVGVTVAGAVAVGAVAAGAARGGAVWAPGGDEATVALSIPGAAVAAGCGGAPGVPASDGNPNPASVID